MPPMLALTPYTCKTAHATVISTSWAPTLKRARYVTQITHGDLITSGSHALVTCNEQSLSSLVQVRVTQFMEFQGRCVIFQVAQAGLQGFDQLVIPVYWVDMGRQLRRKYNRYQEQWDREVEQKRIQALSRKTLHQG